MVCCANMWTQLEQSNSLELGSSYCGSFALCRVISQLLGTAIAVDGALEGAETDDGMDVRTGDSRS